MTLTLPAARLFAPTRNTPRIPAISWLRNPLLRIVTGVEGSLVAVLICGVAGAMLLSMTVQQKKAHQPDLEQAA